MKIKDIWNRIFGVTLTMDFDKLIDMTESEQRYFWDKVYKLIEPFKNQKLNGVKSVCYKHKGKYYDLTVECKFKGFMFHNILILEFEEITEDEFLTKVIEYKK